MLTPLYHWSWSSSPFWTSWSWSSSAKYSCKQQDGGRVCTSDNWAMDRRLTIHIFAVIFNIIIVFCIIKIFTITIAIMSHNPNNEDMHHDFNNPHGSPPPPWSSLMFRSAEIRNAMESDRIQICRDWNHSKCSQLRSAPIWRLYQPQSEITPRSRFASAGFP